MMQATEKPDYGDGHSQDFGLTERLTLACPVPVAVIGLGYVGLPLAVRLAEVGQLVVGIDIDESVVNRLKSGRSTVVGLSDARIDSVLRSRCFRPLLVSRDPESWDPDILRFLHGTEVFVICVHTPLSKTDANAPDIQWIEKSVRLIERVYLSELENHALPRERLLILESTTYPGTTRQVFRPILEHYGSHVRTYIAYSPERTNPGPNVFESSSTSQGMFNTTKIVGGDTPESGRCVQAFYLYKSLFTSVHSVPSLEAAEFVKLLENSFRFVSIAFALEMADIAQRMELNIWDIIDAAKTKGFGLDLCHPGLIGGHCIPIDPIYLKWFARTNLRTPTRLLTIAQELHDDFRRRACELVRRTLVNSDRRLQEFRVCFWGVTYKEDVADTRESAVKDMMKSLAKDGAVLSYWDPVLDGRGTSSGFEIEISEEEWGQISEARSSGGQLREDERRGRLLVPTRIPGSETNPEAEADCIVLAVDHGLFDDRYDLLMRATVPVVDLRNAIGAYRARLQLRLDSGQERQLQEEKLRRVDAKMGQRGQYALLGVTGPSESPRS